MGVVTSIVKSKRKKSSFSVYVDYEFFASIDQEILYKYKIEEGKSIDSDNIKEMLYSNDCRTALDNSMNYLGYSARSSKEIKTYLMKKGYQDNVIEYVLSKLKEYNYVNDNYFAEDWVKEKKTIKQTGKNIIKYELQKKGISDDMIEAALSHYTYDDEMKNASELYRKFSQKYIKLDKKNKNYKIGQALYRKGYSWDIIKTVIQSNDDENEY